MLATALLLLLGQSPSCINSNGTSVCGFDCKGESGKVKCAQTPEGVCATSGGNVACFDPPQVVRATFGTSTRATCIAKEGRVACGYACAEAGGQAACTQTPAGVCDTRTGRVVCFDPPPEVFAVWGTNAPKPSCESREGKTVCGYGCVSGGGNIACARTPAGSCIERGGQTACFDPPARALCAGGANIQKPTCTAETGKLSCGYDCKVTGGDVKCAQTPAGKCTATAAGTTCFDPPVEGGSQKCLAVIGDGSLPRP
jgi:hypothetical protein